MRRILLSLIVLALAGTVAIGATRAYFSDTETSTGNTFTAGTLDLKVNGNDDPVGVTYTLADWKPGDDKNVGPVTLRNAGTVAGKYWIEIKNVKNYENDCLGPEVGDTSCGAGINQGELGGHISGYFQENVTPWSHLTPSITSINASEGVKMDGRTLTAGESVPLVFYAKWLSSVSDNLAQGDSVMFDLIFHLDQI